MSNVRPPKQSTEADIEALEKICERLYGFGLDVSLEWVDGFLTALVASRRQIAPAEWLPKMFDDTFERAYLSAMLKATRHNISEAARRAQIDRMHLYKLITQHRLNQQD
mgnify:CR=1 FL=1